MNIHFSQIQNLRALVSDDHMDIGGNRLSANDTLNLGDPLGKISVRSILQALDQYTRITQGECNPQMALLIFAATANPRALDFYFPLTRMYTERDMDLFYQFLERIIKHPYFDFQIIDENNHIFSSQAPLGIIYMVAGHLAEVFFNRMDIFERFFAAPRHFRFYINFRAFEQDGGIAGGDYHPQNECIQLVIARLFEGFFGPTAGVCPFLHEFGHMLDHFDASTGKMGSSEGLLPGLSPGDGAIFNSHARVLFIRGKRLELERYLTRYHKKNQDDLFPIGHPYVFQNDGEFIAGYFEMFFRNPHYFSSQNQDLYQSFVALFKCDPRKAWRQDFPFYINENRNFYLSGQQPLTPHLSIPKDYDG